MKNRQSLRASLRLGGLFFGQLLLIGLSIVGDLFLIGGEIAEARRVVRIAGLIDLMQIELAGMR